MKAYAAFLSIELKSLKRDYVSLFFMIVLPLILTFVFGGAFGQEQTQYGANILGIDVVVPINVVFLIANAGLMGIPITIAELKEQGVIKRYITYPVEYKNYFAGLTTAFTSVCVLSTILFGAVSFLFFDANYHMNLVQTLSFILIYLLNILIFFGLGFFISLVMKSSRSTNIVTSSIFMALLFTSGIVLPVESLPIYMQKFAPIFPMYHSIEVLRMTWIGQFSFNTVGYNLLYLIITGAFILFLLKIIRIKWD